MVRGILQRYVKIRFIILGQGFEIYKCSLSSRFVGVEFCRVANDIYRNFKAILFALELESYNKDEQNKFIFPNPGEFKIP